MSPFLSLHPAQHSHPLFPTLPRPPLTPLPPSPNKRLEQPPPPPPSLLSQAQRGTENTQLTPSSQTQQAPPRQGQARGTARRRLPGPRLHGAAASPLGRLPRDADAARGRGGGLPRGEGKPAAFCGLRFWGVSDAGRGWGERRGWRVPKGCRVGGWGLGWGVWPGGCGALFSFKKKDKKKKKRKTKKNKL